MPMDVSPTGSGSRENAFTASYRAEWAHFEAAIAGEAKVASLAGAPGAPPGHRRDLPVGGRRAGRGPVRRGSVATGDGVGGGGVLLAAVCSRRCRVGPPALAQRPGRHAAPPASELTVLPHDLRPGPAGLGALRPQRDLDPRSRSTAPTRPTTTASSTSTSRTSCCGSSAGRCGTGWRAFPPSSYVAQYERDNRSVWVQELELPPSARLELQRLPAMERGAGAPVLPLRLLPGQLLDPGPRRARPGARRRAPASDRSACRPTPPTGSIPSGSPPTIPRSSPACCSRSGSGWTGRSTAWEEMFLPLEMREHRAHGHGRRARAAPRSRWSGRSAPSSSPPRRRRRRTRQLAAGYLAIGVGHRRGARRARRASARVETRGPVSRAGLGLGAAGGTGRTRAGGALGSHRSRHGGPQREPAADEPALLALLPVLPGAIRRVA